MIAFLNGTLVEKEPTTVIVDVGGVGYDVAIPLSTYDALPPTGQTCRLLIHDHLREDAHLLFGFATESERALFRLLQNVTGIGTKTALGALSGMSPRDLKLCIVERNTKRLSQISGIGKKTAERIVVELADKIDPLEAMAAEDPRAPGAKPSMTSQMRDAVLALCALGHPQDVALKRVQQVVADPDAAMDTEALIKRALAAR
jgi:Holliday junction DNA helicase RuvA